LKHVHFMGIGGVGISALAYVLQQEGWRVSGCDASPTQLALRLSERGIKVYTGHSAAHLQGVDMLVASNALPENHPEIVEADRLGIERRARMQVLGDILSRGSSIGVSGTHGKTTTTSMLAHIFTALGADPVVLVGAVVPGLDGNVRWGDGLYRIAEVDESDPRIADVSVNLAVITNLEDDHVAPDGDGRKTYHGSRQELEQAMRSYAAKAGRVLYNADWPVLEDLSKGLERVGYGLNSGHYRATRIELTPGGSAFDLTIGQHSACKVKLAVPGRHNVENAVAALAVAHLEGFDMQTAAAALADFGGAARRFETLGYLNGAQVVDDYAHHPTEVKAALDAAGFAGKRLRVVFQPHRYLRTKEMWPRFAEALMGGDEVWVLDVYPAGEKPIPGVSGALIAKRMKELGHNNVHFSDWESVLEALRSTASSGDLVLTMGAGNVRQLGLSLLEEQG